MAESHGLTTLRCDVCRKDFSSPVQMAFHVMKIEKHRRRLSYFAPQQVKELARLQYFLDNHMREEPILGLEYIMEEQLEPENYRYTCQLCHQGGDQYTTFIHIMSKWHMERYIKKHHPSLLVINSNQPIEALYIRELRDKALAIQKEYGRKEMQRKQSEGNSPAKQKQLLPILVNKRPGYCHICNVSSSPTLSFCQHILGNRHRIKLWKVAPGELKKQARMQYILDTYLKEEPVVGLGYVVEEQLEPDNYGYTCQLCDVKGDLYMGLSHIFSREHMQRYIEKHRPAFLLIDSKRPIAALSLTELRDKAFTIQKVYGRQEMQRKQSGGNGPAMLIKAEDGYICTTCNMFCDSFSTVCKHIVGNAHQKRLRKVAPEDVKKLARMQYILDNYLKEDPVLGLEYIVEWQDSKTYSYTCSLCDVEFDLYNSLVHVAGEFHMRRYIEKHYHWMLPKVLHTTVKYARELRDNALTIQRTHGRKPIQNEGSFVSVSILTGEARPRPTEEARPRPTEEARPRPTEEARKSPIEEFRPRPTEEARPRPTEEARPRPTEEARPSPTEEARKSPIEEFRPSPTEEARKSLPEDVNEESGPFLHDGAGLYNCRQCRLCDILFPSPVDLWNHVVGSKHKELLSKTSPKELKELDKLQYFLNNHMKKDPLLGLEYIVEEQLDSTSYKYTCQLCNVEGDLPLMITHISCVDHVERYIDKDHSDLSLRIYTYPERADYIKALTIIAFIILDKCGRQDIDSKCT